MSAKRPHSRKGKADKKAGAKTPKVQIKELTEENTNLKEQLENITGAHGHLKEKMDAVTSQLVNSINKRDFMITDRTDLSQLTADVLLDIINKLVVKKRIQEQSVEQRVVDLENRVTSMSMDVAKLTKKCFAYESGLEELVKYKDVEKIKDKIYQLQFIAGQEYHTFSRCPKTRCESDCTTDNGVDIPNTAASRVMDTTEKLNLVPPSKKYSGDTHIRMMHGELKLCIIKELSLEKASGADWRMLASRVGIEEETIQQWQSLKLDSTMGRVFSVWGESPTATVRILHRHLMSPQLRCTILGKKVSDFYDVL